MHHSESKRSRRRYEDKGAFTSAVSVDMLKSVGCKYVLVGHSERRQIFGETDEDFNKMVKKVRVGDYISPTLYSPFCIDFGATNALTDHFWRESPTARDYCHLTVIVTFFSLFSSHPNARCWRKVSHPSCALES